ncbi:MAG: hypothetical protein AMXMBFR84_26050 [Candidatus Hydrogenedentota bacterium]
MSRFFRIAICVVLVPLLVGAMGPNPQKSEELQIGGGPSDPKDGGTDIDSQGNIDASKTVQAEQITSTDDASVADDLDVGGDASVTGTVDAGNYEGETAADDNDGLMSQEDKAKLDAIDASAEDFEFNAAGDSGTPQAIDDGQTLTLEGGDGIETQAAATRKIVILIPTGGVTTTMILDGTIATADIASAAITSGLIADGTIVVGDLADGAVTSGKILDGTIVVADIADGAVTGAKILDGTITGSDISSSAALSIASLVTSGNATIGGALGVTGLSTIAGLTASGRIAAGGAVADTDWVIRGAGSALFYKGAAVDYTLSTTDIGCFNDSANSRFIQGQSTSHYGVLQWVYNATTGSAYYELITNSNQMIYLGKDASGPVTARGNFTVNGTSTLTGNVDSVGSVAGFKTWKLVNTNTGTGSGAYLQIGNVDNASDSLLLITRSTGYTTSGAAKQDGADVWADANLSGGLSLAARHSSGDLRGYAGGVADGDLVWTAHDNQLWEVEGAQRWGSNNVDAVDSVGNLVLGTTGAFDAADAVAGQSLIFGGITGVAWGYRHAHGSFQADAFRPVTGAAATGPTVFVTTTHARPYVAYEFDPDTDQSIFISIHVPGTYVSGQNWSVGFDWGTSGTSGNCRWDFKVWPTGDSEQFDSAAAETVSVTTAADSTSLDLNTQFGLTFSGANIAADDWITIQVTRDANHVSDDTLTASSRFVQFFTSFPVKHGYN